MMLGERRAEGADRRGPIWAGRKEGADGLPWGKAADRRADREAKGGQWETEGQIVITFTNLSYFALTRPSIH